MVPAIKLTEQGKRLIADKALDLGADRVTFLSLNDYHGPASPDPPMDGIMMETVAVSDWIETTNIFEGKE
jgi:hypothetical protein